MKHNHLKLFLILKLVVVLSIGCSDDNPDPIPDPNPQDTLTGSLVFYTNIQAMINCGDFDVVVRINNDSVGILSKPYLSNNSPDCSSSDTTLFVTHFVGNVNYKASFDCGKGGYWTDEVEILADSCMRIFLDADEVKINN